MRRQDMDGAFSFAERARQLARMEAGENLHDAAGRQRSQQRAPAEGMRHRRPDRDALARRQAISGHIAMRLAQQAAGAAAGLPRRPGRTGGRMHENAIAVGIAAWAAVKLKRIASPGPDAVRFAGPVALHDGQQAALPRRQDGAGRRGTVGAQDRQAVSGAQRARIQQLGEIFDNGEFERHAAADDLPAAEEVEKLTHRTTRLAAPPRRARRPVAAARWRAR